ncbi:hypothetical protein COY25_04510 [Candidatus Uhrbacteria bacterium CG_4_10_14_0_2_um_filter_41_7]|nr:MAG: hypothetical protein COY25_04510 [Candidatus Uhrbacteria bacterium CG_4_10_14_0_2_um_filter_41_7]
MIGTIFVSTIMLAIFGSAFWRKLDLKPVRELAPKFKIEATIIFSTVSALFLTFLIIQSFYLFGGKNAWDNIEGITYSEYAVNGFGELAVISILVISLILSLRYLHTEVTKKIINILEAVLVVETVLVVASAWTRLNLYVSEYGFTPARLFGFWFFITVSITLLLLLVNILRQANQADFMRQATVFIGVSMLIFTVSAPDAFSVRLNINRATTEKPMDIFPLFDSLTAEAYPLMNLVINTKTVPIKGLIEPQPAIEDYCGYFHDRRSRDDAYVIDAETRIDIERWNVRWNNYNYERLRGEKGTAELKTRNFKTWNLSRATIPYAKYSFIDVLATTPYSYTELKAVCDGAK